MSEASEDAVESAENDLFAVPTPSDDLVAATVGAGWPGGLLDRAMRLRFSERTIREWLAAGFPGPEFLDPWFASRERLLESTLRARQATWEDHDSVADLFADSAERVGDWTVTVERGPNPYAQLRLQENAYLQVIEDRGVLLAAFASAGRSTLVGGERLSAVCLSSWRVRNGFRRQGLSELVRSTPGPGMARHGIFTYWYVRLENEEGSSWISRLTEEWKDRPGEWSIDVDGLTATVHHLSGPGATDERVRATELADLARCVDLINRTHDGLDLFRPYDERFLHERLDDGSWGPKPSYAWETYGWSDHAVLVDGGEIVACAGLWDQGTDVRERWHNASTGEERVVDHGAVLDFGFAEGREDAMAALLSHLLSISTEAGRTTLMAPLEFLPGVAELLGVVPETRRLQVMPFTSPDLTIEVRVARPFTDLAYW